MDITTMNENEKNLALLQFFGSSFPIGAFQHSYGLEGYIAKGVIRSAQELSDYLRCVLYQNYVCFDGRAFCKAYRYGQHRQVEELRDLDRELTAMRLSKENRVASLKTGKALLRISAAITKDERISQYLDQVEGEQRLGNYCIVAGVLSGIIDVSREHALQAYFYSDLNHLLQAGIKTIPLGQTEGQSLIYNLYPDIESAVKMTIDMQEEEIYNFVPFQNLMSMQHEALYSRLYMS